MVSWRRNDGTPRTSLEFAGDLGLNGRKAAAMERCSVGCESWGFESSILPSMRRRMLTIMPREASFLMLLVLAFH